MQRTGPFESRINSQRFYYKFVEINYCDFIYTYFTSIISRVGLNPFYNALKHALCDMMIYLQRQSSNDQTILMFIVNAINNAILPMLVRNGIFYIQRKLAIN